MHIKQSFLILVILISQVANAATFVDLSQYFEGIERDIYGTEQVISDIRNIESDQWCVRPAVNHIAKEVLSIMMDAGMDLDGVQILGISSPAFNVYKFEISGQELVRGSYHVITGERCALTKIIR